MAKKNAPAFGKVSPKNLGIALGAVWGAGLFVTALLDARTGWAATFVGSIGSAYIGYGPNAFGGLMGLMYGFIDGFTGGYLIGWIYNWLCK
ncbi:MAG: bacteriophage holin [Candidatus Micrarchaeota archaeon]|nr:bacteriophage holin [Candidatus Micrarchaeota archaeon]